MKSAKTFSEERSSELRDALVDEISKYLASKGTLDEVFVVAGFLLTTTIRALEPTVAREFAIKEAIKQITRLKEKIP